MKHLRSSRGKSCQQYVTTIKECCWASRAPKALPNNFVHAEWITLHDNPHFRGFVDFLRAELDRVGPVRADLWRDFLRRAVALELSFFEAAYADRT